MLGRGYKLICRTCKCALMVGDWVESKGSKYKGKRKFYHATCFDELFITVDIEITTTTSTTTTTITTIVRVGEWTKKLKSH